MIVNILQAAIGAALPLLFATIGEIFTEKAGNLNLGVEGIMIMGAIMGFICSYMTNNPLAGIVGAMMAGAFGALIYGVLTITLRANQVVTGLAITIFGTGLTGFVGKNFVGKAVPSGVKIFFEPMNMGVIGDIPIIGKIVFEQSIFVYMGYAISIISLLYFTKTSWGLNLRAVGENPASADASGVNINLYKYVHILIGGALMGLGGAYLSLVTVPVWQEGITNGRGWIAVALVIFAKWNPVKALFGAILFGGLDILGYRLQSYGISVNQYLLDILPYLATIIVLVLASKKDGKQDMGPEGLSIPYFREDR